MSDNDFPISGIMSSGLGLSPARPFFVTINPAQSIACNFPSTLPGVLHHGRDLWPARKNPRLSRLGGKERTGHLVSRRLPHSLDNRPLCTARLCQPLRVGDSASLGITPGQSLVGNQGTSPRKIWPVLPDFLPERCSQLRRRFIESSPQETLGQSSPPNAARAEEGERRLISLSAAAHSFSREVTVSKPRFKYDHRSKRLIPIHEEPYGKAKGSSEFSNRGLPDGYAEVTVWPKRLHYRLTTGESHFMGSPQPVRLSEYEKQMCAILGLNELELGIFLKSWEPDAAGLPASNGGKRPSTQKEFEYALHFLGKNRKKGEQ